MPSKIRRRSGLSIVAIASWIEWRPDVVVQVGIGHNHEEIDVMQEEWPEVEFIGFEPHPRITKGLTYPGPVHQYAVGDRSEEVTFYGKPRHLDGSSLFPHPDPAKRDPIRVDMITLDEFFPKRLNGRILLWLDCEGAELLVLKGAERFIRSVDAVNVEMTGKPYNEGNWANPEEVHDWLNAHGFYLEWIHTQRSTRGQRDCVYVKAELFRPEQCCCPCQVKEWRMAREAEKVEE